MTIECEQKDLNDLDRRIPLQRCVLRNLVQQDEAVTEPTMAKAAREGDGGRRRDRSRLDGDADGDVLHAVRDEAPVDDDDSPPATNV